MTAQDLLIGLKRLLDEEYQKAGIKLMSKIGNLVFPNVYIGFLPKEDVTECYPYILIMPPKNAFENIAGQTLPLTLNCVIFHKNLSEEQDSWMDILTLIERTREILIRNKIVTGSYRLMGDVKWDVDIGLPSDNTSSGSIWVTYETDSSYMEGVDE